MLFILLCKRHPSYISVSIFFFLYISVVFLFYFECIKPGFTIDNCSVDKPINIYSNWDIFDLKLRFPFCRLFRIFIAMISGKITHIVMLFQTITVNITLHKKSFSLRISSVNAIWSHLLRKSWMEIFMKTTSPYSVQFLRNACFSNEVFQRLQFHVIQKLK